MKVLFIINDTYGDHDSIGVGILSSIAKKKKWETGLIIGSHNSTPDIIKRTKYFEPDIIAYSLATGEHRIILSLHREIRKHFPSCHYIFGGPHPTYSPEFIDEDSVDTICIGEGEIAFGDYLDRIKENEDYSNINNLLIKRGKQIIKNPLNFLIEDLDSIPFPDRKIFTDEIPDLYSYSVFIYAARGCPHSCSYCSNHLFAGLYAERGKILRVRSVKSIIEEIASLGFKPPMILFSDDNFLEKPVPWLEEFTEAYGKVKIPFGICTTATRIKEPIIKSLKKAGLKSVVYALETGDNEINKNLLKRSIKVDSVIQASRVLKRCGIFDGLQNIILLPVSDPFELDLKTLKINQKIKPGLAISTPLTPYPGTAITKYSIESGYLDPHKINRIEKINKIITVLNFKNRSSMKKSMIVHYFFDLMAHYPIITPIYKFYFLIPFKFLRLFYNIHEINFAFKRYFFYLGIKFNINNIKRLFINYVKYKLSIIQKGL